MNAYLIFAATPWIAATLALKDVRRTLFGSREVIPSQASQLRAFGAR